MANQSVQITTGFAALLLFNTVRFQVDLQNNGKSSLEFETVLTIAAAAFCLACVLNLLQLLLLRLLDHEEIGEELKRPLRRMVRLFYSLAWHCLITPVVLLLLMLPMPRVALGVNALYGGCLWLYFFRVLPRITVSPTAA